MRVTSHQLELFFPSSSFFIPTTKPNFLTHTRQVGVDNLFAFIKRFQIVISFLARNGYLINLNFRATPPPILSSSLFIPTTKSTLPLPMPQPEPANSGEEVSILFSSAKREVNTPNAGFKKLHRKLRNTYKINLYVLYPPSHPTYFVNTPPKYTSIISTPFTFIPSFNTTIFHSPCSLHLSIPPFYYQCIVTQFPLILRASPFPRTLPIRPTGKAT